MPPVLAHSSAVVHTAEDDLTGLNIAGSNHDATSMLGLIQSKKTAREREEEKKKSAEARST